MNKIRAGDKVIVLAGKDKGKTGGVLRVLIDPKCAKPRAVIVKGLNIALKHKKGNPQQQIEGGIVKKAMPLHISNVALFNPATGKADRVGVREVDGKQCRFFKSNKELVAV